MPEDASFFVLEADLKHADGSYRIRIETVEGSLLYEAGPLKAVAQNKGIERLSVPVSRNQLQSGDYILSIHLPGSQKPLEQYYFRLQN